MSFTFVTLFICVALVTIVTAAMFVTMVTAVVFFTFGYPFCVSLCYWYYLLANAVVITNVTDNECNS